MCGYSVFFAPFIEEPFPIMCYWHLFQKSVSYLGMVVHGEIIPATPEVGGGTGELLEPRSLGPAWAI